MMVMAVNGTIPLAHTETPDTPFRSFRSLGHFCALHVCNESSDSASATSPRLS